MSLPGVERHYSRGGLVDAIRAGFRQSGKNLDRLTLADLAPIDEFHVRGRQATLELAEKVRPRADDRVLDIGCGLGGASRVLAATYGCRVIGIDLTEEYCCAAAALAGWVCLVDRSRYCRANALALPFRDGAFDIA